MLEGKLPPDDWVQMELLSSEYGWTPDEIRSMAKDDIQVYYVIIGMKRKIEAKQRQN